MDRGQTTVSLSILSKLCFFPLYGGVEEGSHLVEAGVNIF